MRIGVTGTKGFIGSYFARVPQSEHEIVPIDHSNFGNLAELPHYAFKALGLDAIIHAAAFSPVESDALTVRRAVSSNIVATDKIAYAAEFANIKKIVFLSSMSVYGTPPKHAHLPRESTVQRVINEQTPLFNPAPYGASKFMAERIIEENKAFSSMILRLPGVVGPRGHLRAFIPRLVNNLIKHNPVALYNPNAKFNNIIHVDDLAYLIYGWLADSVESAPTCLLAAEPPGMTISEIVEFLTKKLGSRSKIVYTEDIDRPSFIIDSQRATWLLNWREPTVEETLERYVRDVLNA